MEGKFYKGKIIKMKYGITKQLNKSVYEGNFRNK